MKHHLFIKPWLALGTALAHAGPMGFKSSVMSMGDFSANWQEVWANYATTPRDAWGVGTVWMRSDDQQRTRQALELNYTRLGQRWNFPHAQANLWLLMGVGALQGTGLDGNQTLLAPGVQLDYETTRLYVAGNVRLYRAGDLSGSAANSVIHDYASVRAGFLSMRWTMKKPNRGWCWRRGVCAACRSRPR